MTPDTLDSTIVITPEALRQHWQGHRSLTRRTIDAFPEQALFEFSIGGMRPFSELVKEFLQMAVPSLRGVVTGEWGSGAPTDEPTEEPRTKADLLRRWDEATREIDALWPTIPPHRFQEVDRAFGMYEGTGSWLLLYVIDNEVHHRGQGTVYLRSLGIEPPPFYDRS